MGAGTQRQSQPAAQPIIWAFLSSLLLSSLASPQSLASGRIGPMPVEPTRFRSFIECKTHLDEMRAHDAELVNRPTSRSRASEPVVFLETEGVVQSGRRARYDARLGYVSRIVRKDLGMIQSQYSYSDNHFSCEDGTLTGTRTDGYHLPTFEPYQPGDDPKPD